MKTSKIQTRTDTIIHFVIVPIQSRDIFFGLPHHSTLVYAKWIEVHQDRNNYGAKAGPKKRLQTYAVILDMPNSAIAKLLGELEELQDNDVLYHVQVLPDGVFKNYDLSNIDFPEFFNSPIASLKSALHQTGLHQLLSAEEKILVISEKI